MLTAVACAITAPTSAAFPAYSDLFEQLHAADRAAANMSASHFESFLRGPPNRPFSSLFDHSTAGLVLRQASKYIAGCHSACEAAWKAKMQMQRQRQQQQQQQQLEGSPTVVSATGGGVRRKKKRHRSRATSETAEDASSIATSTSVRHSADADDGEDSTHAAAASRENRKKRRRDRGH